MIQFDAAPAVPSDYPRLNALDSHEIDQARLAAYVVDSANPSEPVQRAGADNCTETRADDDMGDWRTRMYVIWFCYVYENLLLIEKPLYAVEELVLEFKAQDVLDLPERRLANDYAGAGGEEPPSAHKRARRLKSLRPHYDKAIQLLHAWEAAAWVSER